MLPVNQFVALLIVTLAALHGPTAAAAPDLTRTIDFERAGSFYLGPTGAKGWVYTTKDFMTADARQILITEVEPGSPADGVLQVGDVILGVGDAYFTRDARVALGEAINHAERTENRGVLRLIRWRPDPAAAKRQGTETKADLKLRVMGAYSDTSPWDCDKSERVLADALNVLAQRKDFGRFGINALALLATGEPKYIQQVRDYLHNAKWARPDIKIGLDRGGLVAWSVGYQNLVLTEYYLLTGDDYVLPAIREYATKTAMGQAYGGTWGHGFAWTDHNDGQLHGRLGGYGALNQAGLVCYLSLIMSKKCGIEDPEVDAAIQRSSQFFNQFVGHGSIGYGYHRPSLEIYANGSNGMSGNGKNGIAAVAFRLNNEPEPTRFFARLTASLYNTMEYGHSGNSYSYFWDPLGANCGGPELATALLKELRWYYALTRMADGSFVNQPLGGTYGGQFLDPTAAQVLIATLPRRAIYLTGKGMGQNDGLDTQAARETVAAGRWRKADTSDIPVKLLIKELDNWSPIAREWIAKAIAQKQGDFIDQLITLLHSDSAEARAGAAAALGHMGERAAGAVPHLSKAVHDPETIVVIAAGYALTRIGESAQQALPDLLRAVVQSNEDQAMRPRQQAIAYALGYDKTARTAPLYFDGLLPQAGRSGTVNPLDGIDRDLLYAAITKLLDDPSGRTRGCGAMAFDYFTIQDTANMAQPVYDAVTVQSMGYMMFEDSPRKYALDLMARQRIAEGLELCFETFYFGRWGGYARYPARFSALQAYGGAAKPYLPQLRAMREQFKAGEDREMLEATIKIIEEAPAGEQLVSLHDLVDTRLAKDVKALRESVDRVSYGRGYLAQATHDQFYQSACLRMLVAEIGDKAFDDLLAALGREGNVLREQAVTLSASLQGEGVTDRLIAALGSAESVQLIGVLEVLAKRNDAKALPVVNRYAQHEDPAVRAAAQRCAEALKGK